MGPAKIFNRDRETAEIVRFLAHSPEKLLLVTGESGCGKSAIVDKALEEAASRGLIPRDSVLAYRFSEKHYASEGELFPQFLMDSYADLRPSSRLDSWLRSHGTYPDSWGLRVSATTFNFKMVNFKEPHRAGPFFARFCKDLGRRYSVFRIENGENYQAEHNLRVLGQMIEQEEGPKLVIEVGTLNLDDETIVRFLEQTCRHQRLRVALFDENEANECFLFIHQKKAPKALSDISRGNALAIRHYGTTLADLPTGDRVRRRLDGFSPDEMILLWCLTALRGTAEVDFLRAVSGLANGFDPALIRLRLADIVRYEDDCQVIFGHSLFGPYFMSEQFASDVNRYGRRRIVFHLEGKSTKTVADTHELARQYQALGDVEHAWKWAIDAAIASYRHQDFRSVVELSDILEAWADIPPAREQDVNMLLLQTAIRTGDQTSAVKHLRRLDDDLSAIATLLKAQACYLMNRFQEGIALCGALALHVTDPFVGPRALGIRAACFISMGQIQEAADDFAQAKILASEAQDFELELEILRLSTEVEPEPVWRARCAEMMQSTFVDRYPYLQAKCFLNFGVFLALTSNDREGLDQMTTAMAVFKAGNYPEYSYSAVSLSAIMLLTNQLSEARDLLETSEIWCHEQYDTFGLKTNLGVIFALESDWETALHFFNEAQECLNDADFPLADPYFCFVAHHNLAVAKIRLGEFSEALTLLQNAVVPPNIYDYEPKAARREIFLGLFANYQAPEIEDLPEAQNWTTKPCVLEPVTLQFFDFNINVLPADFGRI